MGGICVGVAEANSGLWSGELCVMTVCVWNSRAKLLLMCVRSHSYLTPVRALPPARAVFEVVGLVGDPAVTVRGRRLQLSQAPVHPEDFTKNE